MELSYTLQTFVGMLYRDQTPEHRSPKFDSVVPEPWTMRDSKERDPLISAIRDVLKQPSATNDGRFPIMQNWGSEVPALLVEALVNRQLPALGEPCSTDCYQTRLEPRIANNLVEITKPVDVTLIKTLILHCRRVDIEQAVALVFRLLPSHVTDLVPLVPTIVTQSCMWLETEDFHTPDTDLNRRQHLHFLLTHAGVEKQLDDSWESLATLLFRIRRNRPADASRGLRLPDWLWTYYNGDQKDLSWTESANDYPTRIIPDPIIVSKINFRRLTRYVWRLLPNAPEKILRREIRELSQKLLYAQESREAISKTNDRAALAYTFLALQRRLQLTIVSDLNYQFLKKGEARSFQQNTPYIPTNLEERLAEIVMAQEKIDWTVFTAVQRPKGVDTVESMDELLSLVDRVCKCFEDYVVVHGKGHTEPLRTIRGRYGGFRGPVDDWNAAVDVLAGVRRRITTTGYQVVSKQDIKEDEDGGFEIIGQVTAEETTDKEMEVPKADKFLALDIMRWNQSWGDDVFALAKMPPQWFTWLQKRRAEGKCPLPLKAIVID